MGGKEVPPNDAKNVRPMNTKQADYVGWSMRQYVKVSPKKTESKKNENLPGVRGNIKSYLAVYLEGR